MKLCQWGLEDVQQSLQRGQKEKSEKITKGIGIYLKLQDIWSSAKSLNRGKQMIIDRSNVSGDLKKISKAYQEVSEIIFNNICQFFATKCKYLKKLDDTAYNL